MQGLGAIPAIRQMFGGLASRRADVVRIFRGITQYGFSRQFVSCFFLFFLVFCSACGGTVASTRREVTARPGDRTYSARPAADIAAFARSRHAGDDLSSTEAAEAKLLRASGNVNPKLVPGDLLLGESRLLLSNLGARRSKIFVFPTSTGKVCYLLTGAGPGCVDSFTSFPGGVAYGFYDLDGPGGEPPAVHGLIPNDVRSVSVAVAGTEHEALVANNAFFYELDAGEELSSLQSLTVRYADGAVEKIRLATQHPG
jgi:hypothetical protein